MGSFSVLYVSTICRTIQAMLPSGDGESLSQLCSKISVHPAGMQYSWIVCVGLQYIDVVAPLTDVSLVCFILLMPVCMFVFCMQVTKAYVSQATMHCMVQVNA